MTKSALLASVAAAAGLSAESGDITVDAGFVKKHFPDVASALISEGKAEGLKAGADAERTRIAGIEAAALPGHEKIIAAHKADPSKSPADAAMAIIAAENAARGSQKAALDKKIADRQRAERADAIAQVRTLMAQYGLTLADIGKAASAARGRKKAHSVPAPPRTWRRCVLAHGPPLSIAGCRALQA